MEALGSANTGRRRSVQTLLTDPPLICLRQKGHPFLFPSALLSPREAVSASEISDAVDCDTKSRLDFDPSTMRDILI